MRRFAPSIRLVLLVCVLLESADSLAFAQSSRTAPLPVTHEPTPVSNVARTRLFQKQRDNDQPQTPATPKSSIPLTPPGQRQTPSQIAAIPAEPEDPLLTQVKQAIAINRLRFLDPSQGHTPWMIMHGVLALRQEYELKLGDKTVNAIDYVTKQNPIYVASLPNPLLPPGAPVVHIREHWFQSTAYGGRAQPYVVSFAFEGHTNQFLAILSMAVAQAVEAGFTPMITPALVRADVMAGAGFLDVHAEEVYHLEVDDLYLTGTSEVALAGYHADEILDLSGGPRRYAGWSACYRREAGSYG